MDKLESLKGQLGYDAAAEWKARALAAEQMLAEAVEALERAEAEIKYEHSEKMQWLTRALDNERKISIAAEALKPFAACADELDGSEFTKPAPDDEWAKFRLTAADYRRARRAHTDLLTLNELKG